MRLFRLAVMLVSILATPAWAQTGAGGPADAVRALYAPGYDDSKLPMSARLSRLYKAASDNSARLNEPVAGLDFSWVANGQDSEDNYGRTLTLSEISKTGSKAVIKASFRNFGRMELDYEMVFEAGSWVVDDIHSRRKPLWTISKMLTIGAKQK
jgi:hypothetical protein